MQQTTNYQLNQWDPEDRILRTDFNADNAKIDTALKSQADSLAAEKTARESAINNLNSRAGLQLITAGSGQNSNSLTISLSAVSWLSWKAVHICLDPVVSNSSARFSIYWGGNTAYSLGSMSGNTTSSSGARKNAHIILLPMFNGNRTVNAIALGMDTPALKSFSLNYTTAPSLQFSFSSTSDTFLSSTTYQVWGEK